MKVFRSLVHLTLVAGLLAAVAFAPVSAPAQTDEDLYRENTDIDRMFHKLGRGVSNVLLGWVELPKSIAKEWRRTEPFTGTITGTFKGLGWTIARTFVGVYEVISFPFPVPRNYEPIMYPEFVLPSVWGERLPIYEDEFLQDSGSRSQPAAMRNTTGAPTAGETFPRTRTY